MSIIEGETIMKGVLKPQLVLPLVTVVLLASTLAIALLLGFPGHSQAGVSRRDTLHVFDHVTNAKFITVGTSSDPRGNYVVFEDPVFDASDTHQIGHDTGMCVTTSKTIQHCQITFFFSDGEIALQGPQTLSGAPSTMVDVGGTGVYRGEVGAVTTDHMQKASGVEFEFFFLFQ
jgi:hypothetical protein